MRHPTLARNRWTGWLLFSLALASVCGCGRTARITGTVTYQGRPVRYGAVTFASADRKIFRSGIIESDGSYAVEGVPRGTVNIGVVSRDPAKSRTAVPGGKPPNSGRKSVGSQEAATEGWFPLPPKFEYPGGSGTLTVGSGHVSFDIDLK